MKRLRFAEPLPGLVLDGSKDATWRIDDEKEITVNDTLSLCKRTDNSEFAQAEVSWVKMTTFGSLTSEDMEGHEKFSSHQEMLDTYSKYYNLTVTDDTVLKVIKFKIKKRI
jgi:hypothetical protein